MEGKNKKLFLVKPITVSLSKSDLIVSGLRLNPDQSTVFTHLRQISVALKKAPQLGQKELISTALE